MSDEISESGEGKILPRDDKSPSRDERSPSSCDETPSVTEGRQQDATASDNEGIEGKTGVVVDYSTGIDGSCRLVGVSVENVGSISSASMRFSRLN